MLKKCGKKCFLGNNKSFPVCNKNTCKISTKGVYAAFVRARQHSSKGSKYRSVAARSRKILGRNGSMKPYILFNEKPYILFNEKP